MRAAAVGFLFMASGLLSLTALLRLVGVPAGWLGIGWGACALIAFGLARGLSGPILPRARTRADLDKVIGGRP